MNDTLNKPLICIVEDEPVNAELLRLVLEDEYEICVATTGQEAIDIVSSRKPHLILLDIMLPDMSGYDVCETLQNIPDTAHIPVIFVTGLEDRDSETLGLELGAMDYVVKPVVASIVKARIERVLQTDLYIEYLEKSLSDRDEKLHTAGLK